MPPENLERRTFVGAVELRAAPEGSKSPGTLVGYAAVFNKLSLDLGYFRERIAPGAFAECLKTDDVRALDNHEPCRLLGRNTAGTLRMAEDEVGLRVEIDLPDTTVGRDVAEETRRGDKSGQSFSFTTDVDEWDMRGEVPIRTLVKVRQLFDVGPVTFPAYDDTSVAVRGFTSAREARAAATKPAAPDRTLSVAKARQALAAAALPPPAL